MKKEEIIFELSNKVVKSMLETSLGYAMAKDSEFRAYSDFTIKFKYTTMFDKQESIKTAIEEFGVSYEEAEKLFEEYVFVVKVYMTEDSASFIVTYENNPSVILLDYHIPMLRFPMGKAKVTRFKEQTELRAMQFFKIILLTLYQLDSSNYEPVVSTKFLDAPKGNKKKNKKNKNKNKYVKYLVTKKYNIDNFSEVKAEKTEREYTKPSWSVKGYWRHYKSGKKVWIAESTRRRKGLEDKENTEPTVVKIAHTINK